MKALFVYRFLTLGGVETVLRTRSALLPEGGIEPHFWFLRSVDGLGLFRDHYQRVGIGGLDELASHLGSNHYGVISTIDTPELLRLTSDSGLTTPLVLECHTPYPQNLAYLSDVPQGAVSTVIVPSRWQAGEVKRRLRAAIPIDIIPNPLGEGFSEPVTSFPYTRERPIVAWLGRLDDLKNWRGFLEIAGVLAGEGMEFDVWLGARAPSDLEVSEVFHAARRCGLLEQLKWFRNMLHGAMPRFLDAVRDSGGIVVSTARGESFGMTLAEAMARECPVIAPSIGPIPEFIENEVSGILVPPEDIPQAVAACRRLLRDRDLRLAVGRNARASIMRHHEPRQAVARLSTVLWRRAQREAARGSLP